MKYKNLFCLLLILLFVSACASPTSIQVNQGWNPGSDERFGYEIVERAEMTEDGRSVFDDHLQAHLGAAGVGENGAATRNVNIEITDYQMQHGAARYFLGWFAGDDIMISEVTVTDAASGERIGRSTVKTESRGGGGSVSGLIDGHAEQIVDYLKKGGE